MSELMDTFWRAPPVSRTVAAAVFAASLACYGGVLPYHWLNLDFDLLFSMPPQIWRLATSFLITRPKLSIVLDPYFLFSYLKQLEVGNPRFPRREDMAWYLAFVMSSIIVFSKIIGAGVGSFLPGLILALSYTCTQDQRGQKANVFFLTIPAQLVPYSMILVDLLMVGPFVLPLLLCGLLSAHLYDFLSRLWPEFGGGPNLIQTPAFMARLVGAPVQRVENRGFGHAFQGTGRAAGAGSAATASGSSGSGLLPDSWRTRGRGQRLGGD